MDPVGAMQTYLAARARETEAEILAESLNLSEILKSREIVDVMELPHVPRSTLLVKGILEGEEGQQTIPLVDLRVRFDAVDSARTDEAMAVIVSAGTTRVGLIVDRGCEA